MTLGLFAILSAVTLVSSFIQGALGIGFALIVAPVVGILKPDLLPVTLLLLMLPLNFHVAWRERSAVDWSGAKWITLGRFAGTFAGVWLGQKARHAISPETFRRIFLIGLFIIGLQMARSLL